MLEVATELILTLQSICQISAIRVWVMLGCRLELGVRVKVSVYMSFCMVAPRGLWARNPGWGPS